MSDNQTNTQSKNGSTTFWQIAGRLIVAAIVLAVTAFFTPGFHINSIWALALAAIVLTVLDYIIAKFTGIQASPFGKGFVLAFAVPFVLYAFVLF